MSMQSPSGKKKNASKILEDLIRSIKIKIYNKSLIIIYYAEAYLNSLVSQ